MPISFDTEEYDTDSIWTSANPSRLTVPQGVTWVNIKANILFNPNGSGIRQVFTRKNGGNFNGETQVNQNAISVTSTRIYVASPVLKVQAGDYFEILPQQTSGGNVDIGSAWAALEVIA